MSSAPPASSASVGAASGQLQGAASTTSSVCCELFIEALNRSPSFAPLAAFNECCVAMDAAEESRVGDKLSFMTPADVSLYIDYCQTWQQKQCVCIYTNDELIEKFHHFLHNLIETGVHVIEHFAEDFYIYSNADLIASPRTHPARKWPLDAKEKLLQALAKTFSLNMPLYITYKHILFNYGRYNRIKECSCAAVNTDSLAILQLYCQINTSQLQQRHHHHHHHHGQSQEIDSSNLPIELLRNICHFVQLNGFLAIQKAFKSATPDTLPVQTAHVLFNVINNVRVWLNTCVLHKQVVPIRNDVIRYMCELSDRDLRLAGTKNTTDLMYESFKDYHPLMLASVEQQQQQVAATTQAPTTTTGSALRSYLFKVDVEGLQLAYKYFMSSTLTIRLCGINQMNLQINSWSEFNSSSIRKAMSNSYSSSSALQNNELADWFVKNKIIEHLFGPNLHVEVIKRSQDIMNFLALSNRISEKHLDIIWSSAQLKHCSKPVMDTLMSLYKHLNVESIKYLSRLIAALDISQQNEQTILLSALLTKSLWSLIHYYEQHVNNNDNNNRRKPWSTSSPEEPGTQTAVKKPLKRKISRVNRPPHADVDENELNRQTTTITASGGPERSLTKYFKLTKSGSSPTAAVAAEKVATTSVAGDERGALNRQNGGGSDEVAAGSIEVIPQKIVKGRPNESTEAQIGRNSSSNSSAESSMRDEDARSANSGNHDNNEDDDEEEEEDDQGTGYRRRRSQKKRRESSSESEMEEEEDEEDDDDEEEEEEEPGGARRKKDDADAKNNKNSSSVIDATSSSASNLNTNEEESSSATTTDNPNPNNGGGGGDSNDYEKLIFKISKMKHSTKFRASLHSKLSGGNNTDNDDDDDDDDEDEDDEDEEDDDEDENENASQSSVVVTNPSSVKNMKEFESDEDDDHGGNMGDELTPNVSQEVNDVPAPEEDDDDNDDDDDELIMIAKNMSSNQQQRLNRLDVYSANRKDRKRTSQVKVNDDVTSEDESRRLQQSEPSVDLGEICLNGHTFLWDLIISAGSQTTSTNATTAVVSMATPGSSRPSSAESVTMDESSTEQAAAKPELQVQVINNSSHRQHILKEAEKQLQTLLCLPSTDKRIRMKFIESCLLNLKLNRACQISIRMLMKLFSSFQQQHQQSSSLSVLSSQSSKTLEQLLQGPAAGATCCPTSTISRTQEQLLQFINDSSSRPEASAATVDVDEPEPNSEQGQFVSYVNSVPSNLLDVHKVVAFVEYSHGMMHLFFDNLKKFILEPIKLQLKMPNNKYHLVYEPATEEGQQQQQQQVNNSNSLTSETNELQTLRASIQARLQFLSFVYSTIGSPNDFEMSSEHVEILWELIELIDKFPASSSSSSSSSAAEEVTTCSETAAPLLLSKRPPVVSKQQPQQQRRRPLLALIKDDLFNWFLNQAKHKEQHALGIETFKMIFVAKISKLDPNCFSQVALHFYQELFKIYKYSVSLQHHHHQSSSHSQPVDVVLVRQIEQSAIDYICKLAFKSHNGEVSLAAIQFLNSQFTLSDNILSVECANKFVDLCMGYMNEACDSLDSLAKQELDPEMINSNFLTIQRGILLLKNHLDLFKRRLSYQLRLLQLDYNNRTASSKRKTASNSSLCLDIYSSHLKSLKQVNHKLLPLSQKDATAAACEAQMEMPSNGNFVTIQCHINQYMSVPKHKFTLKISSAECLGDLKAIVRDLVIRKIKRHKAAASVQAASESSSPAVETPHVYVFVNNHIYKQAGNGGGQRLQLLVVNDEPDVETEMETQDGGDEVNVKLFLNGQELVSTAIVSNTIDSKQLSDLGLKETQTVLVNVTAPNNSKPSSRHAALDINCIPMNILSKETHFRDLFRLINTIALFDARISHFPNRSSLAHAAQLSANANSNWTDGKLKAQQLASKVWEVIVQLPTNQKHYDELAKTNEAYLSRLADELDGKGQAQTLSTHSSPYQLLYDLQIIEMIHYSSKRKSSPSLTVFKCFYRILNRLTQNMADDEASASSCQQDGTRSSSNSSGMNTSAVFLECLLVLLKFFCSCLFEDEGSGKLSTTSALKRKNNNNNSSKLDHPTDDGHQHRVRRSSSHDSVKAWSSKHSPLNNSNNSEVKKNCLELISEDRDLYTKTVRVPTINLASLRQLFVSSCPSSDSDLAHSSFQELFDLIINIQILAANSNRSSLLTVLSGSDDPEPTEQHDNRVELLHFSMLLLSSCLLTSGGQDADVAVSLSSSMRRLLVGPEGRQKRLNWFKSILCITNDDQPALAVSGKSNNNSSAFLRSEACKWLYRICVMDNAADNLLEVILSDLLSLLNIVVQYKPPSANSSSYTLPPPPPLVNISANSSPIALLKTPLNSSNSSNSLNSSAGMFGSCKDYFILVTNLILSMPTAADHQQSTGAGGECLIDLNKLIVYVSGELEKRDCYETLNKNSCLTITYYEDDVLIGLLRVTIAILKQLQKRGAAISSSSSSSWTFSFIDSLYSYLFELKQHRVVNERAPSLKLQLPKCRSSASRQLCFDLLVQLCSTSLDNYKHLLAKLIRQHEQRQLETPAGNYLWDYWPRDDSRSACGYVGLVNLGATCYMATAMQHLFMIEEARNCILMSQAKAANVSANSVITNTSKTSENSNDESKSKNTTSAANDCVLGELRRMFAYLLESERKAYNPKSFCQVYTMDQQPLNTGEQKDMQEFFTDLISKLEETSNGELKKLIKSLFGGVITNMVISLDCPHVSSTLEEFYTVRCQVAGMKDLYDSLNEITVKDTLEGDNMYTCSKCGAKKVRAEKRACFRQLPRILCFNTMRYTFNMVTMLKEKVNTHFSFPLKLDMSGYMERNLIPASGSGTADKSKQQQQQPAATNGGGGQQRANSFSEPLPEEESSSKGESDVEEEDAATAAAASYTYELIGVTVHTGTAEGGHYYSFIRERDASKPLLGPTAAEQQLNGSSPAAKSNGGSEPHKWYLFNDSEVKPFDAASQLAAECFGGETTSKTYDSATDKFLDLSFEKTHSAYMLFYERIPTDAGGNSLAPPNLLKPTSATELPEEQKQTPDEEGDKLLETIWQDNLNFLNDKHLFEHAYFNFMWQMCEYVPRSMLLQTESQSERDSTACLMLATELACSFMFEIYVHSRDKPNMLQWLDMITKYFSLSAEACRWFVDYLCRSKNDGHGVNGDSGDKSMPLCTKHLIKCPNPQIRQTFQKLLLNIIGCLLRSSASSTSPSPQQLVQKFITLYLDLIDTKQHLELSVAMATTTTTTTTASNKYNIRYMLEYFTLLHEFAKCGREESLILIRAGAIQKCVRFYLQNRHSHQTSTATAENGRGVSCGSRRTSRVTETKETKEPVKSPNKGVKKDKKKAPKADGTAMEVDVGKSPAVVVSKQPKAAKKPVQQRKVDQPPPPPPPPPVAADPIQLDDQEVMVIVEKANKPASFAEEAQDFSSDSESESEFSIKISSPSSLSPSSSSSSCSETASTMSTGSSSSSSSQDETDDSSSEASSSSSSAASSSSDYCEDEDDDDDDQDVMPLPDQKSKLKVFDKIISLVSILCERASVQHHLMHQSPPPPSNGDKCCDLLREFDVLLGAGTIPLSWLLQDEQRALLAELESLSQVKSVKQKLARARQLPKIKLSFFYKVMLDDLNLNNLKTILFSIIRSYDCHYNHDHLDNNLGQAGRRISNISLLVADKFIDMCTDSICKLQDKSQTQQAGARAGTSSGGAANLSSLAETDRYVPFFNMLGMGSLGLLATESDVEETASDSSGDNGEAAIDHQDDDDDGRCDCVVENALRFSGRHHHHVSRRIEAFTPFLIDKLKLLIDSAPYTLQWLSSLCVSNRRVHHWLLDNMGVWVKPLLIAHKQTSVRFSAAVLLANLIPNRLFRETYTSSRNMLIPFKIPSSSSVCVSEPTASSSSLLGDEAATSSSSKNVVSFEINCDLESAEFKQVLHRVIKYLFSIITEIGQYAGLSPAASAALMSFGKSQQDGGGEIIGGKAASSPPTPASTATTVSNNNRLVQYFTFLIYCMCSPAEKALVLQNQTIDKFWLLYYPHISNNHCCTNLNKQVAVHFFYHAILNCSDNINYLIAQEPKPSSSSSTALDPSASVTSSATAQFTSRIARELPMCTIAVDHEDGELISFNRQCLHAYYSTIRILCQHSRAFTREMCTHPNFLWAFKHILPFSIQYPLAAQELNKCIKLFIHQETEPLVVAVTTVATEPAATKGAPRAAPKVGKARASSRSSSVNSGVKEPATAAASDEVVTPKVSVAAKEEKEVIEVDEDGEEDEEEDADEDEDEDEEEDGADSSSSEDEEEEDEEEDEEDEGGKNPREKSGKKSSLKKAIMNFKENLVVTLLMNPDVDTKQCWQSIVMVMKSIIETIDDATLILTRRGLSVLSGCFSSITILYQHHQQQQAAGQQQISSSSSSLSAESASSSLASLTVDLCDCLQIIMQLCEAVKHHVDKRTDGIKQIIQAWKERNDACKRALMLVNFHNSAEVRNRALELVRLILLVSLPADTVIYQNVVNQIYHSFFSAASQSTFLPYLNTANCLTALSAAAVAAGSGSASGSSFTPSTPTGAKGNLTATGQQQSCCPLTQQLFAQTLHLMGPYFPTMIAKKLGGGGGGGQQRPLKPQFNMFLPVMFISHMHMSGAVMLSQSQSSSVSSSNTNLDYEKSLLDSYIPFLTFFDWLCRNLFTRRLIIPPQMRRSDSPTTVNDTLDEAPHSDQLTVAAANMCRQLIDLILIISQQFVLLNVSFIQFLNNFLNLNQQDNSTAAGAGAATETQKQLADYFLNQILDSSQLYSFINAILVDYRYLLNRKEIYDFIMYILPRLFKKMMVSNGNACALNSPSPSTSTSSPSPSTAASSITVSTILLNLKSHIERSCQTLNELRFYFEFQLLADHLRNSIRQQRTDAAADKQQSPPLLATKPNIVNLLDFKASQMLGSVRTIYLLLVSAQMCLKTETAETSAQKAASTSAVAASEASPPKRTTTTDDYASFKFKADIRSFLIDMVEYLKVQLFEMNKFVAEFEHVAKTAGDQDENMEQSADENTTIDAEGASAASQHPKKPKLDSPVVTTDHAEPTAKNNKQYVQAVLSLLKQVESKKKFLELIMQTILQTIKYITESLAGYDSSSSTSKMAADQPEEERSPESTTRSSSHSSRSSPSNNAEEEEEAEIEIDSIVDKPVAK